MTYLFSPTSRDQNTRSAYSERGVGLLLRPALFLTSVVERLAVGRHACRGESDIAARAMVASNFFIERLPPEGIGLEALHELDCLSRRHVLDVLKLLRVCAEVLLDVRLLSRR